MDLVTREAGLNKGVDVDADVDPPLPNDHAIGNSGVHLVVHYVLGSVAKHQSASEVALVSNVDLNVEWVALADEDLENQELVDNVE